MRGVASAGQLRWSLARTALVLIPLILLLGTLSARAAGSTEANPWFMALIKPDIYPPSAVFGIVWPILYVMLGLALALVWNARGARLRGLALTLFAVQLVANLAWSPLFFRYQRIEEAVWLIVTMFILALLTAACFATVRRMAGALLLPYLAWLAFAGLLNWRIHELNPDGGPTVSIARISLALPQQE
ncbi:MAG: TspO/MBR family protein [Sphingomonadaceae bacterium]|nr:TspO/MBR family protein [Sphingomonadaceae bacterium]